jgi:triosephosphate isomerase
MNTNRRTQLDSAIAELSAVKDSIEQIRLNIEAVRDEEQDSFDCLPENLQEAEKGEKMNEAIYQLDDAMNQLELIDFNEIIFCIEIAKE